MEHLPFSPAADRNKDPILGALRDTLPSRGHVLEVASGTGQHIAHFAKTHPQLNWQPTDVTNDHFEAIRARVYAAKLNNVLDPIVLDARSKIWPVESTDFIYCANLIHISPWPVAIGLLEGASRVMAADGVLAIYGPFRFDGEFTAPSNAAFDLSLRGRDPAWGVRDVADLDQVAARIGLIRLSIQALPANNHLILYGAR